MLRLAAGALVLGMAVASVACDARRSSQVTPSPVGGSGFAGQWSGTTFQGLPISFTVSAEQRVTRISVGYRLDACVGTDTSSDVTSSTVLASPSGLIFTVKLSDSREVSVQAYRMPDGSLSGVLLFTVPPACGPPESAAGPLSVSRR